VRQLNICLTQTNILIKYAAPIPSFTGKNAKLGICEIRRVLEPGGKIVLCFTSKTSIETKKFAKHIQLFEADEIEHTLNEFGFQDIKAITFSDNYRQYICIIARSDS